MRTSGYSEDVQVRDLEQVLSPGKKIANIALGANMISHGRGFALTLTLLAGSVTFIALAATPQSKDPVVPVIKEPGHHIRFDKGRVRVYDVRVPTGKWTEFHEHSWDNFFVWVLNCARQTPTTTSSPRAPTRGRLG
jgi:hypothetical protein